MHDSNNFIFKNVGNNSGNGSVMRLAAVPILFNDDIEKAMKVAGTQSLVTHNGAEAYECSRLLAFIIYKFINYVGSDAKHEVLDNLGKEFKVEFKEG